MLLHSRSRRSCGEGKAINSKREFEVMPSEMRTFIPADMNPPSGHVRLPSGEDVPISKLGMEMMYRLLENQRNKEISDVLFADGLIQMRGGTNGH